MLYPRESETREIKELGGLWDFQADPDGRGLSQKWFSRPLPRPRPMPVPASYNDLTQDPSLRDHRGDVWYQRTFFAPVAWRERTVTLRVGSASHLARVWVNGQKVMEHRGGFLPFAADISRRLRFGGENRLAVQLNNILDWTTLPPGETKRYPDKFHPSGYRVQEFYFDFFNYSGIHRPVRLIVTPRTRIDDITVDTDIRGREGRVRYQVKTAGGNAAVRVRLWDAGRRLVAVQAGAAGTLAVPRARFWWPGKPYLYTLQAEALDSRGNVADCYRLPVGIRTVAVSGKKFLINGRPFYFKGFGKHEDADLRGKGLDDATNIKDFNLLEWIGANSFRTSHYPYAEEIMNLADERGVAVIDEVPATGMHFMHLNDRIFTPERVNRTTLARHVQTLRDLVQRDKNHPCVVMWSVANEAATHEPAAVPYFKTLAAESRRLDPSRPVTIVNLSMPETGMLARYGLCRVAGHFDVVCLNRYYSWYYDPGHLELIAPQAERELRAWYRKFRKPVIMTEYGADTIAGLHADPPVMFTEEYQCALLERYHRAFDRLDFVVGEHVWNFADFATQQEVRRVMGNKKGVFTRQRQPKMAAHLLRARWLKKPSFS